MNPSDRAFSRSEALNSEIEDLLWQLSAVQPLPDALASERPVRDDEIESYRRGEMSVQQRRRFEHRLAASDRGMERLAQLPATTTAEWRFPRRLAAATLIGMLSAAALLWLREDRVENVVSEVPVYSIHVQGLTHQTQSTPHRSEEIRPGSMVRIVARPAKRPDPDPNFALYRHRDQGVLEWIREASAWIRARRGTAVLEAEATALVGSRPGLHRLVLLIGPENFTAPSSVTGPGLDELVNDRGVQVHAFDLRLLPPDDPQRPATWDDRRPATALGRRLATETTDPLLDPETARGASEPSATTP